MSIKEQKKAKHASIRRERRHDRRTASQELHRPEPLIRYDRVLTPLHRITIGYNN